MKIIQLDHWEDFSAWVEETRKTYGLENYTITGNDLLFRGQSNANWDLLTTLDRASGGAVVSLGDYYRKILCCLPQLEAFSDKRWAVPSLNQYEKAFATFDSLRGFTQIQEEFELMVFLRHHGFPSPLLDWTRSPNIAALFAFEQIDRNVDNVSIYCYLEHIVGGKLTSSNAPYIKSFGPYIRSHKRHFLQQCNYTICLELIDGTPCYVNHNKVLSKSDVTQDAAWEIQLPSHERKKVLSYLDSLNINSFSLLGSTESLLSTIAFREFEIRGLDT